MSFDLPRSAIIILERLTLEGPMTPKDISVKVDLAPRTISAALRKLTGLNLCKKVPNLQDMRQPLYLADVKRAREFRRKFEHIILQIASRS
ncbi:MAG: MarR family transcriptional regulator [Candidatus Hermodarchaeota archaeon]